VALRYDTAVQHRRPCGLRHVRALALPVAGAHFGVMTYDEVLACCRSLPGAWEDTPWEDDELRAAYPDAVGFAPYLDKTHWVRISLDGTVPDDELRELLEDSYRLVVQGLTRAQRAALAQNRTLAKVPTWVKPTFSYDRRADALKSLT